MQLFVIINSQFPIQKTQQIHMIQLLFSIISQYAVYLSAGAAGTALLIIGKSSTGHTKRNYQIYLKLCLICIFPFINYKYLFTILLFIFDY